MTSLLRQKTSKGVISCGNRDLYEHVVYSGGGSGTDRLTRSGGTMRSSVQLSNFVYNDVQYCSMGDSSSSTNYYEPVTIRSPTSTARKLTSKSAPITVVSDSASTTITGFTGAPSAVYQEMAKFPAKTAVIHKSKETIDDVLSEKSSAMSRLYHDSHERLAKRRISAKKIQLVQQWLDNKLNDKHDNHEEYNKLNQVLGDRNKLMKEIDRDIQHSELSQQRRKELRYKNWYLNVYEPIKSEIYKNMSGPNSDYARDLRYIKYLEYLQHVNKYGYVFNDDYEPEDYDPMNEFNMDAILPVKLKDPTNLPERKFHKEENTILKCQTGKKYTLSQLEQSKLPVIENQAESRADLDWNRWLLDQYGSIQSTVRLKSSKKCQPIRHNSEFDVNWNRDRTLKTFESSNKVYVDHTKARVK